MISRLLVFALAALALCSSAPAQYVTFPSGGAGRTQLSATQNLYVASTGNDTANDCTVSGTPCLTLQRAINQYLLNYDGRSNVTNINLANGTYAGATCAGVPTGTAVGATVPAYLSIVGTNGAANAIISDTGSAPGAIMAINGCYIGLQGVRVQSTSGAAVMTQYGGLVSINSGVILGATGRGKLHADSGGFIKVNSGYTSTGNAVAEVEGVLGGQIIFDETAMTITLSGTPVYSAAFASLQSEALAYINSNFITFSGAVTGTRFNITGNAMLETIGGAAASYIPGTVAGTVSGGGYYSPGTLNIGTSPLVASNVVSVASANPTGTTSGTGIMMGGGGTITPRTSGNIEITFGGSCNSTVLNDRGAISITYGTGTAPSNGAAVTGTTVNPQILFVASSVTNGGYVPCAATSKVTGLSVGTAYWFQVSMLRQVGTGTVAVTQLYLAASEI